MKWTQGRQETGYLKHLIYSFSAGRLGADAFLLKFPEGCEIPEHQDSVNGARHYRLNLVIRHAESGGDFLCDDPILDFPRLKLFRPDRSPHAVTKVAEGTRYVLSFGIALKSATSE
ncbi:MAG: 2OG-Fe(II) oxygenase [Myxococcota bacterium]